MTRLDLLLVFRGLYATRARARDAIRRGTVRVDGRIAGGWVQRRDGTIAVHLLTDVGAGQREQIDAEAARLEELLGDVRFTVRFPAPLQAALL